MEAGLRTSELISATQRTVVGLTGTSGTWDYEFAYNHSASNVSDRDHQGYLNEALIRNGFADGTISPFERFGSAGLAFVRTGTDPRVKCVPQTARPTAWTSRRPAASHAWTAATWRWPWAASHAARSRSTASPTPWRRT